MTFTKKMAGHRAVRPTLRSSAAVAAILGTDRDERPGRRLDEWHGTEATRSALIHTTREWNALRHAC